LARYTLNINGADQALDLEPDMPLLWALRDVLGLIGTKYGCGIAQCGACTVQVNGIATRSCVTTVASIAGQKVTTIEGLANGARMTALQQAWIDLDVAQCGYCQAGQIMSAAALLATKADPTDEDIDAAMAGNYCRCGTYLRIRSAIHQAAKSKSALFYDATRTEEQHT
jgi:isoquinoline 1-oxidoreductase alpha subunit